MDYINAFWVGGAICALVQILMEKTKMLPGRIMVMLVCLGALLGALEIYQPFIEFAGAGASVPLLGFGNTLFKGVKEAFRPDSWQKCRPTRNRLYILERDGSGDDGRYHRKHRS